MKKTYLLYSLPFLLFLSCKNEKKDSTAEPKVPEINRVEKTDSLVTTRIDSSQVPKALKYKGNFKDGFQWKDKNGEYIVITSETGVYLNKNFHHENDGSDAEVFAQCYSLGNNQLVWKVNDFIKDCMVDIDAAFKKNSLQVTDLDRNGIAEIWMMYEIACKGDVSPSDLKVIMYEGNQKFAMRGESKIRTGMEDHGKPVFEGGSYTFDKAFKEGPKAFREYAEKLWNKNMGE
ncbi:hypothetical protein PYS58_11045 [Chryseobacterium indologenes]|uniref:M949_RS01915 family surface polysaccharide biosynthesis protein n=1 Tax=Chryseobacterium TaxID=59732 RepID=UPI001628F2F5|nr:MULTISPECIES: hypothetical protein [Chryseobacterium]MDM1556765.1 hypothetical protein [Chryseobacterium indologenes]WET51657.1 hypothetical protein PYS58_11045 [Chryseobacterium indologenes]